MQKKRWLKFLNFDSEGNYLWNIKARPASTEIAANEILLYPNLSSTYIDVGYEIRDKRNATIEMYNAIGQQVYSSQLSHLDWCKAFIQRNVLSSVPASRADWWEWGEESNYWIMKIFMNGVWLVLKKVYRLLDKSWDKFTG